MDCLLLFSGDTDVSEHQTFVVSTPGVLSKNKTKSTCSKVMLCQSRVTVAAVTFPHDSSMNVTIQQPVASSTPLTSLHIYTNVYHSVTH